jgi:uncharacterized protein (DUF697 family)
MKLRILAALLVFGGATAASATETITYTYDARGRVTAVVHSGTVNNGVNVTYSHDNADNRNEKKTTGAPS